MQPFADNAKVASIGDLEIENGIDAISLHGSMEITKDRAGLERAKALQKHIDAIVDMLESTRDLPAEVAPAKATTKIDNPLR